VRCLAPERLVRTSAGYRLVYDWLDVDALEELTAEAGRRLAAGTCALARMAAEAALALVRGPLLADEPDAAWATAERAAGDRLVGEARLTAARAALRGGDTDAAASLVAAMCERNPYDESALRLLMESHSAAGRPALAIAAYGQLRKRLGEELGVDPARETEELYLRILRQDTEAGAGTDQDPAPRAMAGATPSLPGRERELRVMNAALERAAADGIQLLLIEGEAGIGKSRLLRTWAASAAAAGARVLFAECDELERSLPLQPLADALDGYLRTLPTSAAVLAALGPQHALLAPMLRAAPPPSEPAKLDPVSGQAALFAALLAVFERLAAGTPVALLVDDLHVADGASLAWLHFAARRGTAVRLLLVGALRPEESLGLPQARRMSLGPLDLAAARMVVGEERAAELHARSGGHPLFLVELAAVQAGAMPSSLREAIIARSRRSGADAASTLNTAALLGSPVDLDLLAAVLQRSPLELLTHLEEGARRGLLQERAASFAFRHELVRDALAASVGAARRVVLYREAAHALAARPEPEPLQLAYYAREGDDLELAASAYARVAARAAERYDHAESERLLDLAIELSDTPTGRLQRARTRLLRNDPSGAEADALVALDGGAGAPALEAAGWAAYYRRDFPAAKRYADAGARLGVGAVRAACLALGGEVRHTDGELVEADARLEAALAAADSPDAALAPAVYLGSLRRHQGRAREALELVGPATRGLHRPDLQMQVQATAHMVAVHALGALGDVAAALQAIRLWEEDIERQGASRAAVIARGPLANFKAWVLRGLGEFEHANELNWRARDQARRVGMAEAEAHALVDLAEGQLQVGQLDSAARYLDGAARLQEIPHANRWRHELRHRFLRARLALARGCPEEAHSAASDLRRDAQEMRVRRYADLAFLLEVQAAAALDMPIERDAVEAILQRLPEHSGLEAWRFVAEVAAPTATDRFFTLAETYAERLADHAAEHVETFRRHARADLERLRTLAAHA
jgi:AAA ATPase domain/Bacterial transcriptional activator domain